MGAMIFQVVSVLSFSGHLSPLSLTKLPSSCGYTIRSTQKDLVLVAPYDGCFVIIQVGFLLWIVYTCDLSVLFLSCNHTLIAGELLCAPIALVGPTRQNVMSFNGTCVTKPSNGHLSC